MNNLISLAFTVLRTSLLLVLFLPTISVASDYPVGTAADPLWLRTCPVNFFGSNSYNCEIMGLVGAVERISYPGAKESDLIFQFDKNGRVTEVQRRIRDVIGGWGRRKFSYGADGLLASISYNEQLNSDFQYSGGHLSSMVFHVNKKTCTYTFTEPSTERLLIEANCKDNFKAFKYLAELDSRGRILKLDKIGAQQMNTQGPLECVYTTDGKSTSSQCSDGYYTHKFEYDGRGRPVSYNRKTDSGKNYLVLSFSYIDDSSGNWTDQTIHYVDMGKETQLPADVVRSRTIEYFK